MFYLCCPQADPANWLAGRPAVGFNSNKKDGQQSDEARSVSGCQFRSLIMDGPTLISAYTPRARPSHPLIEHPHCPLLYGPFLLPPPPKKNWVNAIYCFGAEMSTGRVYVFTIYWAGTHTFKPPLSNFESVNSTWLHWLDWIFGGAKALLEPGKTKRWFWAKFAYLLLSFCRFSAYGTPSAVFKPTCLQNSPISIYFSPVSRLKWYLILVINSSIEPIRCFSAHMFTVSAYFPFIFCLTFGPYSAGPVLPGSGNLGRCGAAA